MKISKNVHVCGPITFLSTLNVFCCPGLTSIAFVCVQISMSVPMPASTRALACVTILQEDSSVPVKQDSHSHQTSSHVKVGNRAMH